MLLLRLLPRKARDQTPPPPPPLVVVVVVLALFKLLKNISLYVCNKKHKSSHFLYCGVFPLAMMFFCVSHQKKNLIDLPLKKNENPKHNFFFRRIRRRNRGHKRSEFSSLSLFLCCFLSKNSLLGLFFLSSVWQIYFIFSLECIFPHSRNALFVVRTNSFAR